MSNQRKKNLRKKSLRKNVAKKNVVKKNVVKKNVQIFMDFMDLDLDVMDFLQCLEGLLAILINIKNVNVNAVKLFLKEKKVNLK